MSWLDHFWKEKVQVNDSWNDFENVLSGADVLQQTMMSIRYSHPWKPNTTSSDEEVATCDHDEEWKDNSILFQSNDSVTYVPRCPDIHCDAGKWHLAVTWMRRPVIDGFDSWIDPSAHSRTINGAGTNITASNDDAFKQSKKNYSLRSQISCFNIILQAI